MDKNKWEISIRKFRENGKSFYKVTRRLSGLSVAETEIFNSKEEAKKQFEIWLG